MQIQSRKDQSAKGKYKIAQTYKYTGNDYWDWSVWIEASDRELDKIDYVVYNLHFSFPEPVQTIKTRENKFKLSTSGWGVFTIYVRVNFKDTTVLDLEHQLELAYPAGEINDTDVMQNNKGKIDDSSSKVVYNTWKKPLPTTFLRKQIIDKQVRAFLANKHKLLSQQLQINNPQQEETKWVWYSKEQIATLFEEMNFLNADGVRIYFGEKEIDSVDGYDDNTNMIGGGGQLCLMMVLTRSGSHSESHINIIYEEMADFQERSELFEAENRKGLFNFGKYSPPYVITEGEGYPLELP